MSRHPHGPSDIPSINITDSPEPSQPATSSSGAAKVGSLLSPTSPGVAPSLHASELSEAGSVPPSPTLSSHSATFPTTLQLRGNQPDAQSGYASLQLLGPGTQSFRKGSDASMTDVGTSELDLQSSISGTTTATHVNPKGAEEADGKKKKKGKKATTEEESRTTHQIELAQDEAINPAPFAFKPYQLAHILDPKSFDTLASFGGTNGLLKGLGTTAAHGLSSDKGLPRTESKQSAKDRPSEGSETVPAIVLTTSEGQEVAPPAAPVEDGAAFAASLEDRRRVYGENVLPTRTSKTLLQLMWMAMQDKVLILLSIAAVVSLALGLYQDFGTTREPGQPPVEWVEGVAIVIAILIVVIVGSLNDWQKERQFRALNERKDERSVKVIRDGSERMVDIKDVVVGDIALLEPGEIVPCDGIFISGHNVKCDESGATGESDAIKKLSFDEVAEVHRQAIAEKKDPNSTHTDCFIVSGSKVLEGVGKYVIVAVGTKSFNGRIMMALRGDTEITPLQVKLNYLAELIAKIGSVAGLTLFGALMIRFFVQLGTGNPARNSNQSAMAFVDILVIAVTLVVVAVPEGLPLAVTLALAFATKRMTYENLLVRVLGSCETMANASVVCTDKTGTLTQNSMTVVAGSIGVHAKFVRFLEDNQARTNADQQKPEERTRKFQEDFSIDQAQVNTVLSEDIKALVNEAIAVNSTAFAETDENGQVEFVGSKTETALLQFAADLGWADFRTTRDSAEIIQMVPFSSERKAMGVVVRKDGGYRAYFKGASEILARKCSRYIIVDKSGEYPNGLETHPIEALDAENISRTIIFYANQTLRTIALCYREFPSWPPPGMSVDEQGEVVFEDLCDSLTLIGITGIEDPLREGVIEAVKKCRRAGVTVKMCTGDNALTARSIATQCGIFTPGGIIMEGPAFRKLTQSEMVEVVPRLQVLARSSPEDKKILVETLKKIGEIVGVTGDGTNDGPALKTANVGFSMGIAGTEVAKEASDIILMDDNFASIVKAIMWGRCVNDAVRKFLQFQISTNVTAVVITFVSAVASSEEASVLSAVQLLWINIIMDTFAALALATDPATEALLDRAPDKKHAPLFSVDMYKMILMQSVYQIIVILLFHFKGVDILGLDHSDHNEKVVKTLVFNAFVFAQIFNSVNCRRLDRKLNIFEGITKNRYFIGITLLEIVIQVLIVFVGGAAFQVVRIQGREWGISLALGFVSIPWGVVIRCMPNGPFKAFFRLVRLVDRPEVLPTTSPDKDGWAGALDIVRDNLSVFSTLRGGRLGSSAIVTKARSSRIKEDDQMTVSSMLTMAPTFIATAVAAASQYFPGTLSDPGNADPSKSSAALWEGKVQLHPQTPKDDPIYKKFGAKQDDQAQP